MSLYATLDTGRVFRWRDTEDLQAAGWIAWSPGGGWRLTRAGRTYIRRLLRQYTREDAARDLARGTAGRRAIRSGRGCGASASRCLVPVPGRGADDEARIARHGRRMRYHSREHRPLAYRGRHGTDAVFEAHGDDGRTYILRLADGDVDALQAAGLVRTVAAVLDEGRGGNGQIPLLGSED